MATNHNFRIKNGLEVGGTVIVSSDGVMTIPTNSTGSTQDGGTNNTRLATTAFVQQEITSLIGGAPGSLNTLNELAAAINDDASYASTLTTALATKLPLAGGTMTGTLTTANSLKVTGIASSNSAPAGDQVELSGYGLIGNRGNVYITNSNTNGQIVMGISGAHNANPKLTVTTSGITVGGTVSATGGNSTQWNTAYGWGNHASQSYITNSTASLDANKITSGVLNASRVPSPSNGDWWNGGFVRVGTDGVMEVGKYLDFHTADSGGNVDYDLRVTASAGALTVGGTIAATGGNSTNWNTAYGWGNHASAGYYAASNPSGYTNDQTAAEILTAIKTVDGSGSGLDADTLDGYHKADINPAHSHYRWTGISASSTQARRFVIMRLYGCPAHWDSNWQDIHFKVWSESYEATNLKYELCGDYNGGTASTMFQLRLKDAGGSSEHGRFRLVLGTPVDAGWDLSGADTYYVDVYAEASHYMNFTVAADFYSAGFNVNTLPTSGGATSVVYSSPAVSNITTFNEAKEHSYFANHKIWNDGNHGSGSGLDADLLDGQHGSYYLTYGNLTGTPTIPTIPSNNVVEGGTSYSGEYPMVARTSANTIYSHNGIKFNGAQNKLTVAGSVVINGGTSWHSGNDGSGSGLDADLLDGQHGSYYAPASHVHSYLPLAGGTMTGTITGRDFKTQAGYHLQRSDHHSGHLEGSYNNVGANSAKSNPIYTIGSSYNPTDAALSNMYGIGYSHSDASFYGGTGVSGWGMYVAADGDARVFLGGSNGVISSTGHHYVGSNVVWNAGNDGAGSGLDADLLDGQHGSYYAPASSIPSVGNGTLTVATAGSASGGGTFTANQSGNTTITITGATIPSSLPANGGNADTVDGLHASSFWRFDTANNGPIRFNTTEYDFTSTYDPSQQGVPNSIRLWDHYTQTSAPATYGQLLDLYGRSGHWRHQFHMLGTDLRFRYGTYPLATAGWSSWYTQWHSGNDGSGSGLDADLLDGQQGQYYKHPTSPQSTNVSFDSLSGVSGYMNSVQFANIYTPTSGTQSTYNSPTNVGAHHHVMQFNGYSASINNWKYMSAYSFYTGDMYTRNMNTTTWQAWRKQWDSGNDGSGSGLDADLLDGLNSTQFMRSDAANTLGGDLTITSRGIMSAATSTWTGNPGANGKIQYHSNRWYIVSDSSSNRIVQFRRDGSDKSYIDNNGALIGGGNWYNGNDGSGSGLDADLLDGQQGSYYAPASHVHSYLPLAGGTLTGNLNLSGSGNHIIIGGTATNNHYNSVASTTGLTFGGGNDFNNYSIGTTTENVGGTYTKLNIKWHTGIRFFAIASYGGVRFHSDVGMGTEILSIGNGDGHVRVANNLYANGGNLVWNASNDGSGSGLDADTVDGKHATDLLHYRGIVSGDWDTIFTTGTGKTNTSGLFQVQNLASGHSNHPTGVYTYGGVFAWQLANSTFKLYSSHTGDLAFQSGWGNDEYSGWRRILTSSYYGAAWTNANDGSGSGLDADLLDGQHGTYYANESARKSVPSSGNYQIDNSTAPSTLGNGYLRHDFLNSSGPPGSSYRSVLSISSYTSGSQWTQLSFNYNQGINTPIYFRQNQYNGSTWGSWHQLWDSANDGSGSGLDADLLDGQHGSYYAPASHVHSYLPLTGGTLTGELNVSRNGGMTGSSAPGYSNANIELQTSSNHAPAISFHRGGYSATTLYEYDGQLYTNPWTTRSQTGLLMAQGNLLAGMISVDGSGSGLDADLLDGQHGSYYYSSANYPPRTTFENIYNNLSGSTGASGNMNTVFQNSRSGNIDVWSGSNLPSGTTHVQGIQVRHSTTTHYGFQLVNQYNQQQMYHRQVSNNVFGAWNKIWSSSTDGSGSGLDADLLDGQQGSYYAPASSIPTVPSTLPNGSNLNASYGVTAGTGNGLKFWNGSNTYKISMGATAEYKYGPVTDYSIKTTIDSNASTRGFTWGTNGATPIAALNVGNGNMQIVGSFTAGGNISAYSDIRVKDNIEVIPNALDKVKQLSGYTFTRTDVEDKEKKYTGVIAQEVLEVLPEAVQLGATEEDTMSVAYGNMVGLLIESIKELKAEVDDLKTQLSQKEN